MKNISYHKWVVEALITQNKTKTITVNKLKKDQTGYIKLQSPPEKSRFLVTVEIG